MHAPRASFFVTHRRTILALLFGLAFSATLAYAVPPGSQYIPGETLDPTCIPGSSNCSVDISGGTFVWGAITGTLSDQTDLQDALDDKEDILTFSTGLTRSSDTITNNLSTGVSGGQSVVGGTAEADNLTLTSTSDATKGKIIFGTSAYDEATNRLGVGIADPQAELHVVANIQDGDSRAGLILQFGTPDPQLNQDPNGLRFSMRDTQGGGIFDIVAYRGDDEIGAVLESLGELNLTADTDIELSSTNGVVRVGPEGSGSTQTFFVNGTFQYTDGSEQDGYLLTSDTDGIATWTAPVIHAITIQNTSSLFSTGLTGTGTSSVAANAIFLGVNAGNTATNATASNFLGISAGSGATNAANSNFLGEAAGSGATSATNSNFLGWRAGLNATGARDGNFLGAEAGNGATNATDSNFIGYQAGMNATSVFRSNFIGRLAGKGATSAADSNFIGQQTGLNATNASNSNFLGWNAGNAATNASNSNFLGRGAGSSATDALGSNFLGSNAGQNATNASRSNFFGTNAGSNAEFAANSIFIGYLAGSFLADNTVDNTGSEDDYSILLGQNTSTGGFENSIAIGSGAVNTASNQFMIGSTIRRIETMVFNSGSGNTCSIIAGSGISCSSDERLKTNIEDLETDTLDKLLALRTVRYNWNTSPDGDKMIGFIAQDLQSPFPELIMQNNDGMLAVNYAQMTPILVEAIREINAKIVDIGDIEEENSWRDSLTAWLGNATNRITRIFTGEICLTDTDGTSECINKSELAQLKQLLGASATDDSDEDEEVSDPVPQVPEEGTEEVLTETPETEESSDSSVEPEVVEEESVEEVVVDEPILEAPAEESPTIDEATPESIE